VLGAGDNIFASSALAVPSLCTQCAVQLWTRLAVAVWRAGGTQFFLSGRIPKLGARLECLGPLGVGCHQNISVRDGRRHQCHTRHHGPSERNNLFYKWIAASGPFAAVLEGDCHRHCGELYQWPRPLKIATGSHLVPLAFRRRADFAFRVGMAGVWWV